MDKVVVATKIKKGAQYGKTVRGFSTLEIMVAFVVVILSVTAVMSLVFGSQSLLVDSQTNGEALSKAQAMLENAKAQALQDFNLVNPIAASQDNIYTKSLNVSMVDNFTKKITAEVSWQNAGRNQSVELSSLITNYLNFAGSTCSSVLSGDWRHPQATTSALTAGNLLPSSFSNVAYPVTGIDAYQGKLYISVSDTASDTDPTFFIFDVSNRAQKAAFDASLDNSSTTVTGINALQAVGNYVYAASARAIAKTDPTFGQLQIIDTSSSTSPFIKSHLALAGVTAGGVGNSIFYNGGYVYIGLTSTAGSGPEFHIINVSNPESPYEVGHWPAGSMGAGINAILVKNGYAFLAHPASTAYNEQLTVLDISNPAAPRRIGGFFYDGSVGGNGKSLYQVGDVLYFGRTASKISGGAPDAIPEIFSLDVSNPAAVSAGSLPSLGLANRDSANGVLARDNLAFFLTNSQLQIVNTADFSAFTSPISLPNSSSGTAMDCEGNYIYLGSSDTSGNSYITTITAQ